MRYFASLFIVLIVLCAPCSAWHYNTHLQITRDAISVMPPDFQIVFTEHLRFVEQGIKDPDNLIKDWQNHYYIPATNEGGGLDRIDKLIKSSHMKLEGSSNIDAAKQLCYLAHYVADLWNPEELIKSNTLPNQYFVQNTDIVVLFEGYDEPIENYREYLQKRAEWRWKLENTPQIEPLLYSEAVNDVIKIWLSLWQQSGKSVEKLASGVIRHKKEALNINFERLYKEEKYFWTAARMEQDTLSKYDAHKEEMKRLEEAMNPTDTQLVARTQERTDRYMMSKVSTDSPFAMLESSIKQIGDESFFVARVRNQAEVPITSLAFMYPGLKGPAVLIQGLQPGQVIKVQALLPADATKDQIQLIFSTPEDQQQQ